MKNIFFQAQNKKASKPTIDLLASYVAMLLINPKMNKR